MFQVSGINRFNPAAAAATIQGAQFGAQPTQPRSVQQFGAEQATPGFGAADLNAVLFGKQRPVAPVQAIHYGEPAPNPFAAANLNQPALFGDLPNFRPGFGGQLIQVGQQFGAIA